MIFVITSIFHEMASMLRYGTPILLKQGGVCALILGGLVYWQTEHFTKTWHLLVGYFVFLVPHTLFLVALIRGMLLELMRERFKFTLRWRMLHTNFLYDSVFFLIIGLLILFSYDGLVTLREEYQRLHEDYQRIRATMSFDVGYVAGIQESVALLKETGVLIGFLTTGIFFTILMAIWSRNIIALPATALGFRLHPEDLRKIMSGNVLVVTLITFATNLTLSALVWYAGKHIHQQVPNSLTLPLIVAVTYCLAVHINAALSCALFRMFTSEQDLRRDFT